MVEFFNGTRYRRVLNLTQAGLDSILTNAGTRQIRLYVLTHGGAEFHNPI